MIHADLTEAISEAKRFLARAEVLKAEETGDSSGLWYFTGSPLSASVRRASMDLTRALAKLRKG